MPLKRVGFYRELRYGSPDGPSIYEKSAPETLQFKGQILNYLRSQSVLAANGLVTDFFDPEKRIGGLNIHTDGVWSWPSTLPYYLETYETYLPDEFILHLNARGWEGTPLTGDELLKVMRQMQDEDPDH